jgi:hypothetical protein
MRAIGVSLLGLAAARPASAAGPYSYLLIIDPFYNPPGGPLLNFWFASWQSSSLVKPTACPGVALNKEKDFQVLGAPLSSYSFSFGLPFCANPGSVALEIGIEWDSRTAASGAQLPAVQISAEVFDNQTGFGAVLSTTNGFVAQPSSLAPQGLAGGQIMRLIATAFSTDPCSATLSFADGPGKPVAEGSACSATSDVFDQATGRTWTYQIAAIH